MSSFTFSDCPTTVPLTAGERDGKKASVGTLSLTVRNVTTRGLIGTLSVQPEDMVRSGWFKIAGAAATSPAKRDIDCEANATQTIKVDLAVPEGAPPGRKIFTLRIATERDPDNDFADSPTVAFEIPEAAPKFEPKKPFPWWIAAVAAAALVVVGGVIWALLPKSRMPSGLVGQNLTKVIDILVQSDLELDVVFQKEPLDKEPTLEVLAVNPEEGSSVRKGQLAKITYSVPKNGGFGFGNTCTAYTDQRFKTCKKYYQSL